jgi:hypothetical protein
MTEIHSHHCARARLKNTNSSTIPGSSTRHSPARLIACMTRTTPGVARPSSAWRTAASAGRAPSTMTAAVSATKHAAATVRTLRGRSRSGVVIRRASGGAG